MTRTQPSSTTYAAPTHPRTVCRTGQASLRLRLHTWYSWSAGRGRREGGGASGYSGKCVLSRRRAGQLACIVAEGAAGGGASMHGLALPLRHECPTAGSMQGQQACCRSVDPTPRVAGGMQASLARDMQSLEEALGVRSQAEYLEHTPYLLMSNRDDSYPCTGVHTHDTAARPP